MYFNHSTLIAFLGNNAEQRFTKANNVPYTVLSLATTASWKDKQTGEYTCRTDWHRCVGKARRVGSLPYEGRTCPDRGRVAQPRLRRTRIRRREIEKDHRR